MKVWVVSKATKTRDELGFIKIVFDPVTVHFAGGWADIWIDAQPKQDGVSYKVDIAELNPTMAEIVDAAKHNYYV